MLLAGSAGSLAQTVEPGGFHITNHKGYFEFVTRQRENDQKSKTGSGDIRSEESIFEESARLDVEGYAYHPNFLEFFAGGLFGLLQQRFESEFGDEEEKSSDDGTILEFDLQGNFFKKRPYPGSIFGRRYRALEPRPFQSSIQTTTTNYGAIWQYVHPKVPTTIQFNHTEVNLDPLSDEEDESEQKNTLFRFETGYVFNEHNALSFLYTHDEVSEKPFDLDYDADELTLGHRLDFGGDKRHRLESELNYRDQRGTFELERFRWRETLRLQHTESLRSWYQTEVIDRTQGSLLGVPPIEERSYLFSGTVEHQLFQSLISQLSGYAQRQEYENGPEVDRFGLLGSLDYRKRTPIGLLQADYRPRFQKEERTGGEREFEVFREQHAFRDPEPIVLGNPNIEPGSIRITAEDQVTNYQPGRDYRVQRLQDRVEIRRVPTGRIVDGQPVLISYVFGSGGSFELTTVGQDAGVRHHFDFGLTPYYRLRWQDQEIEPETATGAVPEDIEAHIIGAEFDRWSLRLGAEYEDHDSNINPFEAIRLNAGYTHRFESGLTAGLRALWSDVSYGLPVDRDTRFFTLEGRYRHPIIKGLTAEATGRYRTLEDSLSGDDEGIEFDLSLEWLIRETEVRITYEYGRYEDDFAENNSSLLYVQVRRRFGSR
ncbi:MAG: hypothetical protein AMXMBFR13_19760 [Phycisphaerae bacterium]